MIRRFALVCSLLAFVAIVISCSTGKKSAMLTPEVAVVVGDAQLIRGGSAPVVLVPTTKLHEGDEIIVGDESKVKLVAGSEENSIYILGVAHIVIQKIESVEKSGNIFNITLKAGELFSSFSKLTGGSSFSVSTPTATASIRGTEFSVAYNKDTYATWVKVLNGTVQVLSGQLQKSVMVAAGTKVLVTPTEMSESIALTPEDISTLKEWVGSKIDSTIAGANNEVVAPKNLAPHFVNSPREECLASVAFMDTIRAQDPENSALAYSLISGPEGLTINRSTGVVRFTPKQEGVFPVKISVTDDQNNSIELSYKLTVVSTLIATLGGPQLANPGQEVSFTASSKGAGDRKKLLYRFDMNGDGTWDSPATGEFGAADRATHSFEKEGDYKVAVEIKNNADKVARATRTIVVNAPPTAVAQVTPALGKRGTEFVFSATQSSDKRDSLNKLTVRWDFNGDGKWDEPENGQYTSAKTTTHIYDATGTFKAVLEVRDNNQAVATNSVAVTVSDGVAIDAIECKDTVNVNAPVSITAKASDPQFKITKYSWGFAQDTVVDIEGTKSTVTHTYSISGNYTIFCKVTNEKGQFAQSTKTIVVINQGTLIDAGGPYTAQVNSPLTVKGKAQDSDSKITSYAWDFNGDGSADVKSDSTATATYKYTKGGSYIIRFSATTDDGATSSDTAMVTVGNKPPKATAGVDIVSRKGHKVKLMGKGEDPEGLLSKYEWDFNGDGTFDWSSDKIGITEHEFDTYSYPVLRVTDGDGLSALDTVRVVICPEGMETIEKGKYCIDVYEHPNKKGELPTRNVTYTQAQQQCAAEGKRLCTGEEWTAACNDGKKKELYPYGGKAFLKEKCNSLGNSWSNNKVAKTGSFPECLSAQGLADMSGNVAEWTSTAADGSTYVVGGSWQNGAKGSSCVSRVSVSPAKGYFYVGFRCCK